MQTNELIPIFFWEIVFVICRFWCLSCDMLLTYVCILCIIHHSIRTTFNGECCLFFKIKSIHLISASSQPFPPSLHFFPFHFFLMSLTAISTSQRLPAFMNRVTEGRRESPQWLKRTYTTTDPTLARLPVFTSHHKGALK